MTYGLLTYDSAPNHTNLFDNVAFSADFWPNDMVGYNESLNGQKTPNWGANNVVPYLVVKSEDWTQEMTDIINDSVAAWNASNPSNLFGANQLIFLQDDRYLIAEQLESRQIEVIQAYELSL